MIQKRIWSQLELDYLKEHIHDPINQLCIPLSRSRQAVKNKIDELSGKPSKKDKSGRKTRIGKRVDCKGLFFRSGWEANCYRLLQLDKNIKLVEYEPTTFSFTPFGILHGTVSYTPDFKITYQDNSYNWIEVKGFMKPADKTKIRRFHRHYPEEFARLVAVTPGEQTKTAKFFKESGVEIRWFYPDLNKKYRKTIPHWE
jgi:hypothetical protein